MLKKDPKGRCLDIVVLATPEIPNKQYQKSDGYRETYTNQDKNNFHNSSEF